MADPDALTGSWSLDPTWCRPGDGAWVAGGVPRRLWRLGAAGRRVADALENGDRLPAGHEPLTDRLVAAGAVHPLPAPAPSASVTVVIPTRNPDLRGFAATLARVRETAGADVPVVVVDDASTTPVVVPDGVIVVRTTQQMGPGAARTAGAAQARTDVVAFVDDDVDLPDDWLPPLLGHLADPTVAAVAPRVGGPQPEQARRWWERCEQVRSPLDLGAQAGPVRPGGRVPYVPSAVLVVRRQAFDTVGGFDPHLRFGEDVDLVWRLHDAGWLVRYDPRVTVHHRARRTWTGWVRQRFQYGTSAAALARRHPGALVAVRLTTPQRLAAVASLVGMRLGLVAWAAVTARSVSSLRNVLRQHHVSDADDWSRRWALAGQAMALRHMAHALWRPWWPLAAVAAVLTRRGRMMLAAATVVVVADDLQWWRDHPAWDPVRFTLSARLGDVAYGAGVWWGASTQRTWEPLRVGSASPDRVTAP